MAGTSKQLDSSRKLESPGQERPILPDGMADAFSIINNGPDDGSIGPHVHWGISTSIPTTLISPAIARQVTSVCGATTISTLGHQRFATKILDITRLVQRLCFGLPSTWSRRPTSLPDASPATGPRLGLRSSLNMMAPLTSY